MKSKRTLWCIASVALLLPVGPVLGGGSMKCGIHIIHVGGRHNPGKYEVLKKCGEPTFRQGNTWVYESGRGSKRVLRFNYGGFLTSIQEGY